MDTLQRTAAGMKKSVLVNQKAKDLIENKTIREKEQQKFLRMATELSAGAPPFLVKVIRAIGPFLSWILVFLEVLIPICYQLYLITAAFVAVLPIDVLYIIGGLAICFFGGAYPTTIAAVEAWRQAGGKEAVHHFQDLVGEITAVIKTSEEDDKKDDDGDGIADVDQISSKELVIRKMNLAVTAMDPKKVNSAMQGIYSGWIGVVAVLKVQYAKTIALGAAIGDFAYNSVLGPTTAVLSHLLPHTYHKWIPLIVSYSVKAIAISIAWKVQAIISAFHSAIRGGLMVARGGLRYLNKKGVVNVDPDETYLDEVLGWTLAAVGFYWQFSHSFSTPWFCKLVLWPLDIIESWIVWTISSNAPGTPSA